MAPHVYARISGFGWTLLPRAPFRFARLPEEVRSLVAEHDSPAGPRHVTLAFDGETPDAVDEVLDLFRGPDLDHWRVETAVFTCRWPDGLTIEFDPNPPGFYFRGPDGSLVYLQGPVPTERLPPLLEMTGPGQAVRGYGHEGLIGWVELAYEHDGQAWRQTHRVLDDGQGYAMVVTCQPPAESAGQASAAAREVAESLRPFEGEFLTGQGL